LLFSLIKQHGPSWKTVSAELNEQVEKKRTALNCKDKWQQMGGSLHAKRETGPWTF